MIYVCSRAVNNIISCQRNNDLNENSAHFLKKLPVVSKMGIKLQVVHTSLHEEVLFYDYISALH